MLLIKSYINQTSVGTIVVSEINIQYHNAHTK